MMGITLEDMEELGKVIFEDCPEPLRTMILQEEALIREEIENDSKKKEQRNEG